MELDEEAPSRSSRRIDAPGRCLHTMQTELQMDETALAECLSHMFVCTCSAIKCRTLLCHRMKLLFVTRNLGTMAERERERGNLVNLAFWNV